MNSFRKLLRRLKTILWTALTLVVITTAVIVGVGKLLMPYSVQYKPQLEAWLSKEFNQEVRIDSFTGEWKAFGPRIALEGLNLMGEEQGDRVIALQHAALDIKPLNALISGRPLYTFRIIGADLELVRGADGRFELSGLGVSGRGDRSGGEGLSNLAKVGELRLEQTSLSFDDDQLNIHIQLIDINGALQMDGDDLAVEVEASISDASRFRVFGDLGATLALKLDDDQRLANARWHVKTGELMLSEFGKQLPQHELKPLSGWLNAELWGSWAPGSPQLMEGVLDIRDASLQDQPRLLQLDHLNTHFLWRWNDRKSWRLDLSDVQIEEGGKSWNSPSIAVERNIPGDVGIWVSAEYLRVEFPMRVTQRVMAIFNARWPKYVPRAGIGVVRDFNLIIDSDKQLATAGGEFEDLSVTDWGLWPMISGIRGHAELAFGEGRIEFSGDDVSVDWQRNFRSPVVVDIPGCFLEIVWAYRGKDWQVDAQDCAARNEFIDLQGRTRFGGNEGKPAMDINVAIRHARLDALDDYWPESVMKPKVTNWLRRGLAAGTVTAGRFVLSGDMDDWPFRGGEGTLEARLDVAGAELDYYPGWPSATGVNAHALFRGLGMEVTGSIGDIGGAPVQNVKASISDFQHSILEIDYATVAELPALAGFIGQSPLLENTRLDLGQFTFSEPASTVGHLAVPMHAGGGGLSIDGVVQLNGNGFDMPDSGQEMSDIQGEIHYNQDGFIGTGMAAQYHGWPASLELQADWDASEVFGARLAGRFPAALIVAQSSLGDDPLLARIEGESDWNIALSVTDSPGAAEHEIWLQMASGLEGVTFGLPAPLDKPAGARWPLTLRYPIQSLAPRFTVGIDQRLTIAVDTREGLSGPERAAVQLGNGRLEMPPGGFFSVAGAAPRFDLDGWMDVVIDYFESERYPDGLDFRNAQIETNELLLLDRVFDDVDLEMVYDDQVLSTVFDGEQIAGTVRYSQSGESAHSLGADMQRLLLPDPVNQGMVMDTDPSELPEIHLYVQQFRYLGLDLGETRIEAYPLGNGLRIESVEAASPQMNFQARGDWIKAGGGSRSDFDIVVTSESLGSLVNAMQLSSVLEGGQTMVRYDAWWPGPPAAFALAVLNGEMQFSVIDGKILTADPGAGRVLGLISVTELPRRLALDFRDVFDKGFNFDQAAGTVILENGTAHTSDFLMESTAATLAIEGSSDLVSQEFDYVMTVRPGVSQALPVIGAIAAGPGGAAAGLALQGLLREALGDATEARYSIQGPWSEPVVTRLEQARQTAAATTQITDKDDDDQQQ